MTLKLTACAALALSIVALPAAAAPVVGQISIGGYAQGTSSGQASGMGTATGISFANAAGTVVSGTSGLLGSFGAGSGSFAILGACSSTTIGCGTIKDISNFATQGALTSFLTLNTGTATAVSFDLSSITSVAHGSDMFGGSITFTGVGIINFTGYDPTAGQFILTAQGNNVVSFSATNLAAGAVPESATWAMMILGMGAVGFAMRRQKVAARVNFA